MQYFADARIDHFITEDLPYLDLTCQVLGLSDAPGEMEYFTREDCVLAGVAVVRRMMAKLGCEVVAARADGDRVSAGEAFMRVRGGAEQLHAAWKACLNVFDHLSAVATKTRRMVDAAHSANPRCEVLTTRKSMPGVKDLLTYAVVAGGAYPHRLGLSETIIVFSHHLTFMGGFDAFVEKLPEIKARCVEKKIFVEADAEQARILAYAGVDAEQAIRRNHVHPERVPAYAGVDHPPAHSQPAIPCPERDLARAGVDGIQLDKIPADELGLLVRELRAINPAVTLIAAGGINPENAAAYAATGVDGLATTAPFSAKPLDMSVRMRAL
ncbi:MULTISPECIES: ModD protein [unclassified Adlercreutzia]|uniref:ModD protein n=1 Tax=unclassified Adlercreutzia TaxID=2636013 RepID=UPI0013EDEA09|nr:MULTISPECIES: ModD protein [unclassified Adlercreutzia]